jgi:hypothetical protein
MERGVDALKGMFSPSPRVLVERGKAVRTDVDPAHDP